MDKDLLEKILESGISVQGDLVLEKHVENEIGNVENGGIGIQIVHGKADGDAKTHDSEAQPQGDALHDGGSNKPQHDHEPTFLIHPAIGDEEGCRIEEEIVRLVKRFTVQEICKHLDNLAAKGKVMLPVVTTRAYDELARLGMPVEKSGYDYKTFSKYYRKA